jgi:hypothetical protein
VALIGGTASAALTCPGQKYVQPFRPWLDEAQYVLLSNGSLETPNGWALTDGARIVSGNEPWKANLATDTRSLFLPSGSSATSPRLCVTLLHPTLRFFARNPGGKLSILKVEAITEINSVTVTAPIGLLLAGNWQPTVPLAFLENALSPLTGSVRFRFTPIGSAGAWQIDDVYVDPYKGR